MEPQTIQDQSVPLLQGSYTPVSGRNNDPVFTDSNAETPGVQIDQKFPPVVIAQETISQSLNTATKSIKGTFIFEQLGAIKIGSFVNGVSGEVDISPNGITATNVNGDQTFALDGATGNASFRGTVRVGSLIADDANIRTERATSGNGRMVWYSGGLPAIVIGDPS